VPLLPIGSRDDDEQDRERDHVLALPRMRAGLESVAAREPAAATPVVASSHPGSISRLTALPRPIRPRTTAAGVLGQLGLAVVLVLMLPLVLIAVGAPVVLLVRALIVLTELF
jgi:hypothetical protein